MKIYNQIHQTVKVLEMFLWIKINYKIKTKTNKYRIKMIIYNLTDNNIMTTISSFQKIITCKKFHPRDNKVVPNYKLFNHKLDF